MNQYEDFTISLPKSKTKQTSQAEMFLSGFEQLMDRCRLSSVQSTKLGIVGYHFADGSFMGAKVPFKGRLENDEN